MIDWNKPIEWVEQSDIEARRPPVVARAFADGSAVIYWEYKQFNHRVATAVPSHYPYIRNVPEKPAEHWVALYKDGTYGFYNHQNEMNCLINHHNRTNFLRAVLFREVT